MYIPVVAVGLVLGFLTGWWARGQFGQEDDPKTEEENEGRRTTDDTQ